MNQEQKNILARRYAQACIHVFADKMSYKDCMAFEQLLSFLYANTSLSFFLQMPLIQDSIKMQVCDYFIKAYTLPQWTQSLFKLLLTDKRLFLFSHVIQEFICLYMTMHNVEVFTITSATVLTNEQQEQCNRYIHHITGKKIISHFNIDPSLIAGIRMQSSTMLWERSVKKQLRIIQQAFFPIGEDYDS